MNETDGEPARTRRSRLRLRVIAEAAEISGIRRAVAASAEAHGIGTQPREEIALAVSEACANVVMHAYRQAAMPGPLIVEAYGEDGEFVVLVSDEGTGFRARTSSPGLGLGLGLIRRLTQRLEIASRRPNGSTVKMTFAAPAA